jgi:hypothetical protein
MERNSYTESATAYQKKTTWNFLTTINAIKKRSNKATPVSNNIFARREARTLNLGLLFLKGPRANPNKILVLNLIN